jgi:hypothetical protein
MKRGRLISLFAVTIFLSLVAIPASAQTGPYLTGNSAPQTGGSTAGPTIAPPPQGSFNGSVPVKLVPEVLQISLQDAIDRGLKQNLGVLLSGDNTSVGNI